MRKLRDINSALPGLLLGIIIFGAVSEVVGVFLVADKLNYTIGLWIGVLTALGMALHMALCLNSALDRGEKGAQTVVARQGMIRYLAVIVVLAILMITEIGNPIAAFVGILGLKISAYLQPFWVKLSHKKQKLNKE